jgi:murein DD-endopeptidase MepM/ murein hydrolase activator NlpD
VHAPGPFDPDEEFSYDPSRAHDGAGSKRDPGPDDTAPGAFDPGEEFGYDPGRTGVSTEPPEKAEPPWDAVAAPVVTEPPAPQRAVPPKPVGPAPPLPEPETEAQPLPQHDADADAEQPPPAQTAAEDTLDPAPWVPSRPRRPPRQPDPRRLPLTRRRRSRARTLAGLAVCAAIATGVTSVVAGVPLSPLGSDDALPLRGATAAPGGDELASSQAIVSGPGPVHPVLVEGPVDYGEADAKFGADRGGRAHEGQDIFARLGTALLAVRDGLVVDKGDDGGRGNYVAIYSHSSDQTYVYLHMLRPTWLKPGDEVAASTQVGAMGCTGSCYGTHLHFEVRRGRGIERRAIDPLPMLRGWPQVPADG